MVSTVKLGSGRHTYEVEVGWEKPPPDISWREVAAVAVDSKDNVSDIPHIRLRVSKEPAILRDGDGRGIHERRQLSRRAHKTISRCRELASARQRRQLSARLILS